MFELVIALQGLLELYSPGEVGKENALNGRMPTPVLQVHTPQKLSYSQAAGEWVWFVAVSVCFLCRLFGWSERKRPS